jgi:NAD-dependent deacetylase
MIHMQKAIHVLHHAQRIVVFSGAGISAESGIPTYRDKLTGVWSRHNPLHLETSKAFRKNPGLVWSWYLWRRHQAHNAEPNSAHRAIAQLSENGRDVWVVTQNIDSLHERAGSEKVIHLHGSLETPKCYTCNRKSVLLTNQEVPPNEGESIQPPRCVKCNGRLRPNIIWFGEDLPPDVWKLALKKVSNCDVLISVGTSGIVTPAADIPEIALRAGAVVIHVNINDVSLGGANEFMLIGKAAKVLPDILFALNEKDRKNV